MMKLKVNDAQLLTKTMTALAVIVDEATFKVDEAMLKLKEMGPSRVAMVDLARMPVPKLAKNGFYSPSMI